MKITRLRDRLAELGHTLDWRFVGPVCDNRPGDPGWEAVVDGEVVATGGAIGLLERELTAWCKANAERLTST